MRKCTLNSKRDSFPLPTRETTISAVRHGATQPAWTRQWGKARQLVDAYRKRWHACPVFGVGAMLLVAGVLLLTASQLRLSLEKTNDPLPWLLSSKRRPRVFEAETVDGVALLVFGDAILDDEIGYGVVLAVLTLVSLSASSLVIAARHNRRLSGPEGSGNADPFLGSN